MLIATAKEGHRNIYDNTLVSCTEKLTIYSREFNLPLNPGLRYRSYPSKIWFSNEVTLLDPTFLQIAPFYIV